MVKGSGTTTDAVRTINQAQLPIPSNAENVTHSDNLKELQECENRKNNLLVYGIPESKNNTSEGRKLHDIICFKEICDTIFGIEVEIKSSTRLGAKKTGADRPLRVKLANNKSKGTVLKNAKYLAASEYLGKVFINRDMTYLE